MIHKFFRRLFKEKENVYITLGIVAVVIGLFLSVYCLINPNVFKTSTLPTTCTYLIPISCILTSISAFLVLLLSIFEKLNKLNKVEKSIRITAITLILTVAGLITAIAITMLINYV